MKLSCPKVSTYRSLQIEPNKVDEAWETYDEWEDFFVENRNLSHSTLGKSPMQCRGVVCDVQINKYKHKQTVTLY